MGRRWNRVLRCSHTEQSLGCCRNDDETCGSELW